MVLFLFMVDYYQFMHGYEPKEAKRIFELHPIDVATWLISIDAMHALASVVKHTKIIDHSDELAAKRLVRSVGAGDYKTPIDYLSNPGVYPGMFKLATKLGAYSLRDGMNSGLGAALAFKSDKTVRSSINPHTPAIKLYENAQHFPTFFVKQAERHLLPDRYGSVVDTLLTVKSDTFYWIDQDIPN